MKNLPKSITPSHPSSSSTSKLIQIILVILVVLSVFFFLNFYIAGERGNYDRIDFMVLWLGGKGLIEGINLYNPDSWQILHTQFAPQYHDNPIFIFPPPTAILFFPFAVLPVRLSGTIWLLLNEIGIILFFSWVVRQTPFKKHLGMVILISLLVATFQPLLITLESGQFNLFILIILSEVYILICKKQDFAAGAVAVLFIMRPNPIVFLLPGMVIWAMAQKKWKYLLGFATSSISIAILSELIAPGWLFSWVDYTIGGHGKIYSYGLISPTLHGMMIDLARIIPSSITNVVYFILVSFLCGVGIAISLKRDLDPGYVFSLLATISLCITPYAWNYDHVILIFPLAYVFLNLEKCSKRSRHFFLGLLIIIYTIFPYLLRIIAINREIDTLSALVPYAVLALLLLPPINPLNLIRKNAQFTKIK
jgi:hypothetical protein